MDGMGEAQDRAVAIVQRAAGNTVAPAVAALLTVAAAVLNRPELGVAAVPASALAGSVVEESVSLVYRLWAAEGAQRFSEAVESESGSTVDDLAAGEQSDRKTRQLLGEAVGASTTTADEWKIRVLARAFVVGAKDKSRADEMRMLIALLEDFEGVDARCLSVINKAPEQFRVEDIAKRDRGIAHVAPILVQKLAKLTFIEAVPRSQQHLSGEERDELRDAQQTMGEPEPRLPTNYRLTDLGQTVAHLLGRIGALPRQHPAESAD
ncbi:hypothetical protein KBX26_09705 [Micromonospora sp. C97]|uniref:DUF4393 domain-containing protein n=1 Tax=Micromonospora parva TaxID=1464048 RepID=A0ABW6VPC0_9ACTN|nr:hypothetical protein [Micromonospora sp. C97]MBQ1030273.1 hypothetical protein [Micromonospora sp. C97]